MSELVAREERKPKIWGCPKCRGQIGTVMFGQLFLNGNIVANTDGPNLVVTCPECGATKVWYAQDRLSIMITELADQIARKLSK